MQKYKSDIPEEVQKKATKDEKQKETENKQNQPMKYTYHSFDEHFLSFEQSQLYQYDPNAFRWILSEQKELNERQKFKEEIALQNKMLLNRFADFSSASNLVELLQKIPDLKLKLTEEEISVIGQHGNVMVIGRSGTGKTTCAMLRLFAMEVLFHIRVQIYLSKNAKILQDALTNEQIGLQSVFITASPVLANQIKKYYQKITSQVKDEIKRKQELKKKQQQNEEQIDEDSMKEKSIEEAQSLIGSLNEKSDELLSADEKNNVSQIVANELENLTFLEKKKQEEVTNKQTQEDDDIFEDDETNDKFVLTEQGAQYSSLQDMSSKDFPAFLTVRQYLMLIEGCMHDPFFLRSQDGKLVYSEGQSSWDHHKSQKQMQKLNAKDTAPTLKQKEDFYDYDGTQNLDEIYKRELYLQTHQEDEREIPTAEKLTPADRKFEVDYNYFANAFWPLASAKFSSNLISCSTLWTEIYSYIKGSSKSFSFPERYLTQEEYMKLELNALLSEEQKSKIYSMFLYYEKWKLKQSGYDLMDLVNYLLKQFQMKKCDVPSIHFTMIDEVQDLPYAIITLFTMVNEQNLFLAGDSAQTIARGVGFKFGDLQNAFSEFSHFFDKDLDQPVIRQLTVNFRSHNKILQLSNSVVSLIEGLFPSTIDILKKERSNIDGQKPIILTDSDLGFLFTLLQGQQSEQGQIPLEFGCNQVIIVKDEESKKKLPDILQHAICLTIYEAKGLEFDDVILFNFFADSTCSIKQWDSVNLFNINKEKMSKVTFLQMMTMHDSVFDESLIKSLDDPSFANAYGVEYDAETEKVTVNTVITKNEALRAFDRISNSLLCSELKQLYTAITRPKKRIVIFDTKVEARLQIQSYWNRQNLVSLISSKDTEEINDDKSTKKMSNQEEMYQKERQEIIKSVQKLLVKNTSEEWFEQGQKMFRYKYFEQAVKCFKKSGHTEYEKKAQAYFQAKTNSNVIVNLENQLTLVKKGIGKYALLSEKSRNTEKTLMQKQLRQANLAFVEIGDKFLEIKRRKQAAQCYFSGGEYEKAGQIYIDLNLLREAAESYFLEGNSFEKAASIYIQLRDLHKAILCYDSIKGWIQILKLLKTYSVCFSNEEVKQLTEKYLLLEFQSINNAIDMENKPIKQAEEEIVNETVEEDKSDKSFSSFESDHLNDDDEDLEENKEDLKDIEEITFSDDYEEIPDQKQDQKTQISQKSNNKSGTQQKSNSSFSVVGKSGEGLSEMSFDHLSHIDPNDEWLRVENGSVIDKLNQSRMQSSLIHSQFSILDNSYIGDEENFQIIKTRGNTNISDNILKRILYIFSITNSDIKQSILQLIQKKDNTEDEIVLDKNQIQSSEIKIEDLENINFDTLNQTFISTILQNLEQSNQSKIALLICNRFKIYSQIGQILVSLALNYSPLSNLNAQALQTHFNKPLNIKQKELSFVSNTAMHSIFESINSDLIRSNLSSNSDLIVPNIFTAEFIRQFLLLGYWRRILFLMEKKNSLPIAQAYGDFNSYRCLANENNLIQKNIPDFTHLNKEEPNQEIEKQMAIMALEHYLYYQIDAKFISSNSVKNLDIPQYFKFNKFIWNILNKTKQNQLNVETLRELLSTAKSILDKSSKNLTEIQIFDAITSVCILIAYDLQFQILSNKLPSEIQPLFVQVTDALHNFFKLQVQTFDQTYFFVLRAIFTVYQIRTIPNTETLNIFGRNRVIINRQNKIASSIIKNATLVAEEGNIFYCDIDFENIIAPLSLFFTKVSGLIKASVGGILNKLNQSSQKQKIQNNNQKDINLIENEINLILNFTNEQKLKYRFSKLFQTQSYESITKFKTESPCTKLNFGMTELYNSQQFKLHQDADILKFSSFSKQIMVNMIINYNSKQNIKLFIPTDYLRIIQELQLQQFTLLDSKDTEFQKQNPDLYLINLNDYDNFEDIDELCSIILRVAQDLQVKYKNRSDDDDDDYNQDDIIEYDLQMLIFTILANINDAEIESLQDLTKALQLIEFKGEITSFLNNNKNYAKLLNCKDIDDMRDAALDLIEDDEFEAYFGTWKNVTVFNNSTPEENKKRYENEQNIIQEHFKLRQKAGKVILKLLRNNRYKLSLMEQLRKQINYFFEYFERYPNSCNQEYFKEFRLKMINKNNISLSFEVLRNVQKDLLNLYYSYKPINDSIMKFIISKQNLRNQLFNQLSDALNDTIIESLSKKYSRIKANQRFDKINKQIFQQFENFTNEISKLVHSYFRTYQKQKKVFIEQNQQNTQQNQRIQQLLKKRANILKQQKIMELKSLGFKK